MRDGRVIVGETRALLDEVEYKDVTTSRVTVPGGDRDGKRLSKPTGDAVTPGDLDSELTPVEEWDGKSVAEKGRELDGVIVMVGRGVDVDK